MALTLPDDATFQAAKRLLDDCGFNESGLADPAGEDDPKALLASWFLQAAQIPVDRANDLLPQGGLDVLIRLGLVETEGGKARGSVLLYPLSGLHIASDFPGRDLGGEDFVFPAISQQTWEYLGILPDSPCEAMLEIGTGSGAAALLAARYAESVTAADVSPRCLLFAEFNRRLNGVEGVRFVQSDVYDGLPHGETFDRIAAHPPYVPWTGPQEIYRHGGPDGEAILRRLLAGLPSRLRPGGTCHLAAMGLDTLDAPLEQRLREMIGPRETEFDLLVTERQTVTPLEFVAPWKEGEDLTFEEAWSLNQALRQSRARMLVRCSILIERRSGGEPKTLRRRGGASTGAIEMQRELARERWDWDWDRLLDSKPEIAGELQLETVSLPTDEGWMAQTRVLHAEYPFIFRSDCPPWAAEILPRLDGERTLRSALEPLDVDPEEAEAFLGCLVDAGVLTLGNESVRKQT